MRRTATTFALVAGLLLLSVQSTEAVVKSAATARLSLSIKQTPSNTSTLVTLYGTIKPAKAKVIITIQSISAGKWINSKLTAKTTTAGTWSIKQTVTANVAKMSYRATATVGSKKSLSPVRSIVLPKRVVSSQLSLSIKQTPSNTSTLVTLYGTIKPAKAKVIITIQSISAGKWINSKLTAKTTTAGTWSIKQSVTANVAKMSYRATATVGSRKTLSPIRSINLTKMPTGALLIDQSGPGGRILGADISRWQHSGSTPIDFAKMYSVGTRFVMIKASDTHDAADADALKYFPTDRLAAQAAGLYTGFYHYAYLPDTTDQAAIKTDAIAQAQKAIWRLATVGGYTANDLPYALDLEDNCVRYNSSRKCAKYASAANTTLFALTWLKTMQAKTGRAPILYSYPTFLQKHPDKER
jgi:hypothetical protein